MLSIVIPTYNREHLISQTLQSALDMLQPGDEIVVRDNCSTDGTAAVLKRASAINPSIRFIAAPRNEGPVRNWVQAVDAAQGSTVVLLFSDDVLIPSEFDEFRRQFEASQQNVGFGAAMIGPDLSTAEPEFQLQTAQPVLPATAYVSQMLRNFGSVPVSPAAYIFKKETLKQSLARACAAFDGHREAFATGAGIDLLTVAYAVTANGSCFYRRTPHVFFRQHGTSLSTAKERLVQSLYIHSRHKLATQEKGLPFAFAATGAYRTVLWLRQAKQAARKILTRRASIKS